MNSVGCTQTEASSFSFLVCFKLMFLLLYQHLQTKTWRGNSEGGNLFQLLMSIQLQKAEKCLKANSVRTLQGSRQLSWKRVCEMWMRKERELQGSAPESP